MKPCCCHCGLRVKDVVEGRSLLFHKLPPLNEPVYLYENKEDIWWGGALVEKDGIEQWKVWLTGRGTNFPIYFTPIFKPFNTYTYWKKP